jgi:hypothetical protein
MPVLRQVRTRVKSTHSVAPGAQVRIAQLPSTHDWPLAQGVVVRAEPRMSQERRVIRSTQFALDGVHTCRRQRFDALQNDPAPQSASITQSTQRSLTVSQTMLNALHWADERHDRLGTQA